MADLLSVDEAAQKLRISVPTLRYLRHSNRFVPAIRVGRRLFWTERDLDEWLVAQRERA